MKLYDENKNYVGEIEKPEPIEYNGKWWESVEYRVPNKMERYVDVKYDANAVLTALGVPTWKVWIASEIPRATPEQLRAIRMKERDGRPTIAKVNETIWFKGEPVKILCGDHTKDGVKLNDVCRFVLVPDDQKEVHNDCRGCQDEKAKCYDCYLVGKRINYTPAQPSQTDNYDKKWFCNICGKYWNMNISACPKCNNIVQPPRPEEPMFSAGEIEEISEQVIKDHADILSDIIINRLTERRRG